MAHALQDRISRFFDKWGDAVEDVPGTVKLGVVTIWLPRPLTVVTRRVVESYEHAVRKLRSISRDLKELAKHGVEIVLRRKASEIGSVSVRIYSGNSHIIVGVDDVILDVIGETSDPARQLEKLADYLSSKLPVLREWMSKGTPWARWIDEKIMLFTPPWSPRKVDPREAVAKLEELARDMKAAEEVFVPVYTAVDDTSTVIVRIADDTCCEQWIEVVVPREVAESVRITEETKPSTAITKVAQFIRNMSQ